jgi:spermidine/putrescine transport system substrate-binding protein
MYRLKRFGSYLLLFLITALLAVACSSSTPTNTADSPSPAENSSEKVLNVYNWSTYIAPEALAQFQKANNVKIKYDTYDSNENLYAKLKPGNPGYDVVFPGDYMVRRMVSEDMLEKIDLSQVPNMKNLDPKFVNPSYDPGNLHSLPYQWGTMGIGYNIQKTGGEIDSWKAMFDPKYQGKVAWLDDVRYTMGVVLMYLGLDPNTKVAGEINKAKDFILQHKDMIKAFAPDTGQNLLDQGEVDLTFEWSGDIFQVMEENKKLRYAIPKEGTIIWTDNMVIPKGAPHKELAEQFINFVLDPKVGATISNFIHYGSPNLEARKTGLINAEDLKNPEIYPPAAVYEKLKYLEDVGQASTLYDDAWTELKVAAGK